jgi:hypothetical protein
VSKFLPLVRGREPRGRYCLLVDPHCAAIRLKDVSASPLMKFIGLLIFEGKGK